MADVFVELLEELDAEVSGARKPLELPWPSVNRGLGGGLPPGTTTFLAGTSAFGKSVGAAQICLKADADGRSWAYLPFERNRRYALRRFLACHLCRWDVLNPVHAEATRRIAENDSETFRLMSRVGPDILENPGAAVVGVDGRRHFPQIDCMEIQQLLRRQCGNKDLIIIDPLTAIGFDDGNGRPWAAQERFARELAGLAGETGVRILVIHHLRKQYPGGPSRPSGLDDMAGSSGFARFSDNVLILEAHEETESEVIGSNGVDRLERHKRTVTLAKCRDGAGTGWRLAFDLDENGPRLIERGIIRAKTRGRK